MSVPSENRAMSDQDVGDNYRMNLGMAISGPGSYLDTLDLSQFRLLFCTETFGVAWIKDHLYLVNAAGNGVDDITATNYHTHTDDDDGASVKFINIANQNIVDSGGMFLHGYKRDPWWVQVVSGTGSTSDQNAASPYEDVYYSQCNTGSTNGSTADLRTGGMRMAFHGSSYWQALFVTASLTSVATRMGYAIDSLGSADSNTRQYGIATCTATNGNYFVRAADGDSRSESDTGVAFAANLNENVKIIHFASDIQLDTYINGGSVFTKTNDVPFDGTGSGRFFWRYSIKNNTGADRLLALIKLRFGYQIDLDWS